MIIYKVIMKEILMLKKMTTNKPSPFQVALIWKVRELDIG
jgi:hypothetical protein